MIKNQFSKALLISSYVLIPILAFSYKFFVGNSSTKYLYDISVLLLGVFSIFILIQKKNKNLTIKALPLVVVPVVMLCILTLNFIIKVNDGSVSNPFYMAPFLMEMKLPLYIFIIGLSYLIIKPLNISNFIIYSKVFSYLVIVDVIVRFFISGELYRPTIVSESNYDGLFILIGLCALFSTPKSKGFILTYLLFSIATVLTQSKTGIGCLVILSFIHFATASNIKYVAVLFCLLVVSYFIVEARLSNIQDINKIDRFAMWFSFIDLMRNGDWVNVVFGYVPGYAIKDSDPFLWWFIENQSEKVGARGLHSFNYHSFWLRLATTYGALFTCYILYYFINFARKGKSFLYFSILVLLQGFSMGAFYLSVNVLILCMYYVSLASTQQQQHKHKHKI
jgi:hypothetical protein